MSLVGWVTLQGLLQLDAARSLEEPTGTSLMLLGVWKSLQGLH